MNEKTPIKIVDDNGKDEGCVFLSQAELELIMIQAEAHNLSLNDYIHQIYNGTFS